MTKMNGEKFARPLSPHLQVYKPQLTSIMSITHRITGVGMAFGLPIFLWWLLALADGPAAYSTFVDYAHSVLGQLVLFAVSLAFFYHLCNGIRHLLWDAGKGLEIHAVYASGRFALVATVLLTAVLWCCIWGIS